MSCLRTVSQHGRHILLLMLLKLCYVFRNDDLCKLYNTICTFEEEWKTRNKYSFGVKSSCSGQSLAECAAFPNRNHFNTMGLMKSQCQVSPHMPELLNAQESLSNGLDDLPGTCSYNWLMGRGAWLDIGQGLGNVLGIAPGLCSHASLDPANSAIDSCQTLGN